MWADFFAPASLHPRLLRDAVNTRPVSDPYGDPYGTKCRGDVFPSLPPNILALMQFIFFGSKKPKRGVHFGVQDGSAFKRTTGDKKLVGRGANSSRALAKYTRGACESLHAKNQKIYTCFNRSANAHREAHMHMHVRLCLNRYMYKCA